MAVRNGCKGWLEGMAIRGGCRGWLYEMIVAHIHICSSTPITPYLLFHTDNSIFAVPHCWNHGTAIVQRQAQGYAVALRPGDVT
jgi:hypothetical protein